MSTRDLINAIAAGDAIEIENAFNSVMAEKVSIRIDDMRVDVAQNLFAEEVEEIEEEQLDELSKETLKSYRQASVVNALGHAAGMAASTDTDSIKAHEKKVIKRAQGITNAKKRLGEDYGQYDSSEEFELNLEDYSLEELEDFMMSEDFEQLDELSKSTLKSYIRKATNPDGKNSAEHHLNKAGDLFAKAQSAEDLGRGGRSLGYKGSNKLLKKSDKLFKKAERHNDIANNREYGAELAQKKLAQKKK